MSVSCVPTLSPLPGEAGVSPSTEDQGGALPALNPINARWIEKVPEQAQSANVGFYNVFLNLKRNTLMIFRASLHLRNIIHYHPLPLIINSSFNDLRVTDSHF